MIAAMQSLTVRELVAEPSLGLRLIAGVESAGARIRSAHTSDLDHPSRYLVSGELILTNGLWSKRISPVAWADEVRAAGATAIGFGLGPEHSTVPLELVNWCNGVGVPLLEASEYLSFSLVSQHVHDRTKDAEGSALRQQLVRTRRMLLRLSEGGGYQSLLELIVRETDLTAAFVGPGGRILAATREGWLDRSVAQRAAAAAVRGALPYAISPDISAFGVPTRRPISTLLVASPFRALDDEGRMVAEQVAAYAAFEDARRRALEEAAQALTEELVHSVMSDEVGESAFAARVRALALDPARPLLPIATDLTLDVLRYAAEACGFRYAIAELAESRLLLINDPPASFLTALSEAAETVGGDVIVGCGRPAGNASPLRRSVAEAQMALRIARTQPSDDRVVQGTQIGSHTQLLQLLEPATVAAYRDAVLRPLQEWDREHSSELVTTLRSFLEAAGQWRETARRLHIHHNSLRYRLGRVEQLTGRSLSCTADRVDLFLALSALPDDTPRTIV
jgi:purine catabolism regulator